jgi:hypothetical protein
MDRDTSFVCDIDTYFWTQQPSNKFITLENRYEHSQNPKNQCQLGGEGVSKIRNNLTEKKHFHTPITIIDEKIKILSI